ncbi:hypothetical protein NQ318_006160 [Aromia moschata]|uniref:Uncharacterized protein n=1 Tax=Aromia moschata TaxID=1265417 RepID=A0AAV8XLT1_9CUCU|nr:hypothetical protein NQ318_006160 [Aromia moschata]
MNHTSQGQAGGLGITAAMRQKDIRPAPAEIEYKGFKFLITDRPSDQNIHAYIQELQKHRVTAVVRVCEPSYKVDELKRVNIEVFDLSYDDGTFPPNEIVEAWFKVLKSNFTTIQTDVWRCTASQALAGRLSWWHWPLELGLKYEGGRGAYQRKKERCNQCQAAGFSGEIPSEIEAKIEEWTQEFLLCAVNLFLSLSLSLYIYVFKKETGHLM